MHLRHGLFAASLLAAFLVTGITVTARTVFDCDKCKVIMEDDGTVKIRDQDGKVITGLPAALYAPTKPIEPLPALPADFTVPPPPKTIRTINVCRDKEPPECAGSVEAALRKYPGGGLHIRVLCGSYEGTTVDLRRRSNIWIEGVPCADGRLPQISMQGSRGAWVEFSPMGGPEVVNLRVEKLHLTGPGTRKSAIRLNGKGPMVVKDVVVENQQNGVFATGRASGDVWVVNSRFNMNGHGNPGKHHHIYVSCKNPGCNAYVINSHFGGLYSKGGRNCSNQIRFRAREAYVLNSVFDAREGCVSRSINTSPDNHRLVVRDSVFIQGDSENRQIMMTPLGGGSSGEIALENVVAVSLRKSAPRLIGVLSPSQIRLKNVLFYRTAGCQGDDCLYDGDVDQGLVRTYENVRVTGDSGDLPQKVRDML